MYQRHHLTPQVFPAIGADLVVDNMVIVFPEQGEITHGDDVGLRHKGVAGGVLQGGGRVAPVARRGAVEKKRAVKQNNSLQRQ